MKFSCMACGLWIPPKNVNLTESTFFCPRCDQTFPITTVHVAVEVPAGSAEKPPGTRIEFVADAMTLGIIVPAGNNRTLRNVFVGAAVVFNAITAVAVVGAFLSRNVSGGGAAVMVVLGMVLAGVALFFARGEFTLSANRRECTAIWTLFRWNITRRIPTPGITEVLEHEIYRSNGRPKYAILIRHPTGSIMFGGALSTEERRWLAVELRKFFGLGANADRMAMNSAG